MKIVIFLLSISIFELATASQDDAQTKIIEERLKKSIENVKKFKAKKENEIKRLNNEIEILKVSIKKLKRQYRQCQINKKNSANRLTEQLNISENNFYLLYEENQKLKKALLKYRNQRQETTPQTTIQESLSPNEISTNDRLIEPISLPSQWVEVIVENDMDIYELALQYYGEKSRYTEIYSANKHVIPQNLVLANGMSLKVPITEDFRERPFFLNQH